MYLSVIRYSKIWPNFSPLQDYNRPSKCQWPWIWPRGVLFQSLIISPLGQREGLLQKSSWLLFELFCSQTHTHAHRHRETHTQEHHKKIPPNGAVLLDGLYNTNGMWTWNLIAFWLCWPDKRPFRKNSSRAVSGARVTLDTWLLEADQWTQPAWNVRLVQVKVQMIS